MILILNTDYEILLGFLEHNFWPDTEYLVFTDNNHLHFYLKKMKQMGLYNVRINHINLIKEIKHNNLGDNLFILDINFSNHLYWIRHLTNYVKYIGVFKYVALDDDNNVKADQFVDQRTHILELKTHNYLRKLSFKFTRKLNNINYYEKNSIETPFFE
tara:strand:- start:2123 stop:2596 length:474 start_codon:yes stop_codon:yes gene_type:complete